MCGDTEAAMRCELKLQSICMTKHAWHRKCKEKCVKNVKKFPCHFLVLSLCEFYFCATKTQAKFTHPHPLIPHPDSDVSPGGLANSLSPGAFTLRPLIRFGSASLRRPEGVRGRRIVLSHSTSVAQHCMPTHGQMYSA